MDFFWKSVGLSRDDPHTLVQGYTWYEVSRKPFPSMISHLLPKGSMTRTSTLSSFTCSRKQANHPDATIPYRTAVPGYQKFTGVALLPDLFIQVPDTGRIPLPAANKVPIVYIHLNSVQDPKLRESRLRGVETVVSCKCQ